MTESNSKKGKLARGLSWAVQSKNSLSGGGSVRLGDDDSSDEEDEILRGNTPASARAKGNTKEKGATMADMFLSGKTQDDGEKKKKHIPDPPGLQSAKAQKKARKQQLRQLHMAIKKQQKEQKQRALESKVQDYFKAYALFPQSWPEIQQARQDQSDFDAEFRSIGLITTAEDNDNPVKPDENVSRSFKIFAVVADQKVGIRSKPSTEKDCVTGSVIRPGQVVIANNVIAILGNKFIKLARGGWVFEHKDDESGGAYSVMAEVTGVEVGLWWYRVACSEFVEIRRAPTYYNSARSGWIMSPNEVCVISLRCTVNGSPWLQLADGRGWIFSLKTPQAMQVDGGESSPIVMELCDGPKEEANIAQEAAQALESTATTKESTGVETGLWQYQVMEAPVLSIGGTSLSGWWLAPGESFTVDLRAPANGAKTKEVSTKVAQTIANRIWLRLNDGRGWIPKNAADGRPIVRFVGFAPQTRKAPGGEFDTGEESWMQGIA